jgi:hypothetical protein
MALQCIATCHSGTGELTYVAEQKTRPGWARPVPSCHLHKHGITLLLISTNITNICWILLLLINKHNKHLWRLDLVSARAASVCSPGG